MLLFCVIKASNDEYEFKNMYFKFLKGVGLLVVPLGIGILLYKDVVRNIFVGKPSGEKRICW